MYHRDVQLECFGELKSDLFNDSHIGGRPVISPALRQAIADEFRL
ncbi:MULTISPECIES: hypothetical protein [Leptolyngbya]|nr:hypothetical protein [Leptolyngbya sp. FACHB-1624]